MAMKSIIFSVAVASIVAVAFCQDLQCYSCGYREDGSGDKTKIPDEYEDIAFCGVDNLNETEDVPIKNAPPVRDKIKFSSEKLVFLIKFVLDTNVFLRQPRTNYFS